MSVVGSIGRALFVLLVLALLAAGWLLAAAVSWKQNRLAEIEAGTATAAGFQFAERGSGFPIVIFHGAPGGCDQGLALAEGLGLENFRVLAPSRPGFLGTPPGPALTPGQQAEEMAKMLEDLGIGRAAVLGFSTGAPAALYFAAKHPEKTAALALVSGVLAPVATQEPGKMPAMPLRILLDLGGDVGAAWYAWSLDHDFAGAVRRTLRWIYEGEEAGARGLAEFLGQNLEAQEAFRAMAFSLVPLSPREAGTRNDLLQIRMLAALPQPPTTIPVLLLHGTQDSFAPLDAVRDYAAKRPGTQLLLVERGSHWLWIGPDGSRAAAALRAFFEEAASRDAAPAEAGEG